jgi:hypothetical protein
MNKYLKFIDPIDQKKYHIYEWVRGIGEMATYRKGKVIGNKTMFDHEAQVNVPVPYNALKLGVHRGMKVEEYETLEALECELFMEAFEDF